MTHDDKHDAMSPITSSDDPRVTAYALGEADARQTAAVEGWLAAHPEARAEVEALTDLAGTLSDEFAAAPAPALGTDRHQALERELAAAPAAPSGGAGGGGGSSATGSGSTWRRLSWRPFLAAAAVLLAAVILADEFMLRGGGGAGGEAGSRGGVPAPTARVSEDPSPFAYDLFDEGQGGRLGQRGDGPPKSGNERASGARSRGVIDRSAEPAAPATGSQQLDAEAIEQLTLLGYVGVGAAPAPEVAGDDVLTINWSLAHPGESKAGKGLDIARIDGPVSGGQSGPPPADKLAAGTNVSGSPGLLTGRGMKRLESLGYLGDVDRARDRVESEAIRRRPAGSGESYSDLPENPFVRLTGDPESALSTFGLDVDSASYANVRRFLNRNQAPPPAAVRLEELVNAFTYSDPVPESDALGVTVEAAGCPWAPDHRLVRIGVTGRRIAATQRPATNLVFLLDVSGSMKDADKLPLLTQSLELMIDELRDDDRVAIVTYASGSQVVLPSTPISDKAAIVAALRGLRADGSTHASEGIQLAYDVAGQAFLEEGNNRVLLATDGDFNVGVTSQDGLHDLITGKAASGIYLTVLGFGTGNLKDDTAELLADKGNGNYAYIDSLDEAYRVLVRELEGTLHVIAKDAKVQVEFNPAQVASYRLLGYENRALAAADFRNDKKDAGEVGAGHSLTVLYEVVPVGVTGEGGTADLRYQQPIDPTTLSDSPDLLTVNLRWLPPSGDGEATERAVSLVDEGATFAEAGDDLRFAAAVAGFGMVLRGSKHCGDIDLLDLAAIAEGAKGDDPDGRRAELVKLVRTAKGVLGL